MNPRLIRQPSAPARYLPGRTTPARRRLHVLHAWSVQRDAAGRVRWDEGRWTSNILHDEGERYILSAAFDTDLAGYGAPPTNLYLGLSARDALAEDDTLAMEDFNEVTGTGYARIPISTSSGFTLTQPGDYYQASTTELTFTNSADPEDGGQPWAPATERFLCTAASGTSGLLIASIALSVERVLQPGDSLSTTVVIGLAEGD